MPDTWNLQIPASPAFPLIWAAKKGTKRHACPHCGILLLAYERAGFCCGNGKFLSQVPPLPLLPFAFADIVDDSRISSLSRRLNIMFSFAGLETTHSFPDVVNSFVSIQGRVYHCLRPHHSTSPIRWLLYDGFENSVAPHQSHSSSDAIPHEWITIVKNALLDVNPLMKTLTVIRDRTAGLSDDLTLSLVDSGTPEIAAIINLNNTTSTNVTPLKLRRKRWLRAQPHLLLGRRQSTPRG
ncbi:hypothetical protein FISHEDRAFT_77690 [Fistulina hepatica ATCC 64428]|nr:hypothetical protein FISHEDRAFT_77690 [Fistulina hepatica ATCC 64428]